MKHPIDEYGLNYINLPDNFDMTKVIQEQDGVKQKVDEGGNALFTKYETVQKVNEEGLLLYLDGFTETTAVQRPSAFDEEGNVTEWADNNPIIVDVPVETTESRVAIAWETQTVPVISYVQKTDADGNPLYQIVCINEDNSESITETTNTTYFDGVDENDLDPIMIPIEGTKEVQVEAEWLDYEPIMVPNMVDISIKFSERPWEFSVEEIITEKYRFITETVGTTYCLADCFLTAEDLNLSACERVDTGVKLVSIQPYGMAETNVLPLDAPARSFKVYVEADSNVDVFVNSVKVENNVVDLLIATDEVFLNFTETQGKRGNVSAYALLYNEEVVQ